jgi:hypothetical protein
MALKVRLQKRKRQSEHALHFTSTFANKSVRQKVAYSFVLWLSNSCGIIKEELTSRFHILRCHKLRVRQRVNKRRRDIRLSAAVIHKRSD